MLKLLLEHGMPSVVKERTGDEDDAFDSPHSFPASRYREVHGEGYPSYSVYLAIPLLDRLSEIYGDEEMITRSEDTLHCTVA